MINKMSLELLNSPANFEDLKKSNGYFVDKTEYIKTAFTDTDSVLLFTRPRRFGKTMLMTMFESFLQINPEKPFDYSKQLELFKGTKILEDKEFCSKFMGQYPVIYINLKDVDGNNFDEAYRNFASTVFIVASRYRYLLDSPKLDDSDKEELKILTTKSYLVQPKNQFYIKDSIRTLATALYKEYGKYPILLIDEYDVPLKRAAYHDKQNKKLHENEKGFRADYHYSMKTLMSGFFGFLKDEDTLFKVVMTGSLRVYKNRLYSGTNFTPNSVNERLAVYTGMFGFTEDETLKILKDYGLDDCFSKVKEHYAGYKFFDKEIFNPVDVINFVKDNIEHKKHDSEIKTAPYWCDLVSDQELTEHLAYLTDHATQVIQDLVDGKSICFELNKSMDYDCLPMISLNDFLSLLLHKGYLTIDWDATRSLDERTRRNNVCAKLPNLEIIECFEHNIQNRFNNEIASNTVADEVANALLNGDSCLAQSKIRSILMRFISLRDIATKAHHENYYHGYLNGLFTNCSKNFFSEYLSNYEAGDGYADIAFTDAYSEKVAIIEIKTTTAVSELIDLSKNAIEQIKDKHYADPFLSNKMVQSIYAYGIAFSGKNCFISVEKVK